MTANRMDTKRRRSFSMSDESLFLLNAFLGINPQEACRRAPSAVRRPQLRDEDVVGSVREERRQRHGPTAFHS